MKTLIEKVTETVCEFFDILPEQLHIRNRKGNIVQARFICYYFLQSRMRLPFWTIANEFNVSSHASIIYGVKKIEEQLEMYEDVKLQIKYLEDILKDDINKCEINNLSQIRYKKIVRDLIINHPSTFSALGINRVTRLWMYKDLDILQENINKLEHETKIRETEKKR